MSIRVATLDASNAGVALLCGLAFLLAPATAQQPPPAPSPGQQQQHERALQTPSGQHGKEEPTARAPTTRPQASAVLVDGALAVPGAPADSVMAPAKFSPRKAAEDELITLAHTFRHLSDAQRRTIHAALSDRPTGAAFNARVGVVLPPAVELHPLPADLLAKVPQIDGHQYAVANDRVLLVSPSSRVVVGAFTGDAARDREAALPSR
jgi:hypothetical protein